MMTIVTTLLAPPLLVPAFRRGGPGWHAAAAESLEQPASEDRRHGPADRRVAAGGRRQPAGAVPGDADLGAPDAGPRYRLTLPAALAETFAAHVVLALERAGWQRVLTVEELAGRPLVELRRGEDVLSVRRLPAAEGAESIEMEAEAGGWEPALVAAVEATARDLRAALIRAAVASEPPALTAALTRAIDAGLAPPAGPGAVGESASRAAGNRTP
jgi:hypothetical protein